MSALAIKSSFSTAALFVDSLVGIGLAFIMEDLKSTINHPEENAMGPNRNYWFLFLIESLLLFALLFATIRARKNIVLYVTSMYALFIINRVFQISVFAI